MDQYIRLMSESRELLREIKLTEGQNAQIYMAKGSDFFAVMFSGKKTQEEILKSLICRLTMINGKNIWESDLDDMPYQDVQDIAEAVSISVGKLNINL